MDRKLLLFIGTSLLIASSAGVPAAKGNSEADSSKATGSKQNVHARQNTGTHTVANDDSTAGMAKQAWKDFDKADAKLNATYKQVLAKISAKTKGNNYFPTLKDDFIQSEKAWIQFRDLEIKTQTDLDGGGTNQELTRPATMTDLTGQRTKQLENMLQDPRL